MLDLRPLLPKLMVPTLVLHRTAEEWVNVEQSRFLARHIPGARLVELDGRDHWPWIGDSEPVLDEIQRFVTDGEVRRPRGLPRYCRARRRRQQPRSAPMFTIDAFVDECRSAMREAAATPAVKEVMQRAVRSPREVTRELGEPSRGHLAVLYSSADLTVVHTVWAPCMSIYPHDHRMWAVIGIYGGEEDNIFFRRTSAGLTGAGGRTLGDGEVAVLGPKVIHSVSNPRRAFTGAIHVYGGDFLGAERSEWDPATLRERPYDIERVKAVFEDANRVAVADGPR